MRKRLKCRGKRGMTGVKGRKKSREFNVYVLSEKDGEIKEWIENER